MELTVQGVFEMAYVSTPSDVKKPFYATGVDLGDPYKTRVQLRFNPDLKSQVVKGGIYRIEASGGYSRYKPDNREEQHTFILDSVKTLEAVKQVFSPVKSS